MRIEDVSDTECQQIGATQVQEMLKSPKYHIFINFIYNCFTAKIRFSLIETSLEECTRRVTTLVKSNKKVN